MEAGSSTVELQEKEDGEILTSSTEGLSTTDLLASPVKSLKSSNSINDSPLLRTKFTININQQSLNNRFQNTYNNVTASKSIEPNSAISTPNTDNLLDLNFPKFNVLGKEQAKRRLQAFSMFKNNSLLKLPIKKTINKSKTFTQFTEDVYNEDGEKIDEKTITISKPSRKVTNPEKKAKTVIEEIEEIKKIETAYREALEEKLLLDFKKRSHKNRKEAREKERNKDYKLQSASRETNENKLNEKKVKNPPSDWKEFIDNNDSYSLRAVRSKERDYSVNDFRKQLLFESCPVPLNSMTVKSIAGLDKIVPPECIRFTKCHPSIPFNVNPSVSNGKCLSRAEVFNYVPKSHINILNNIVNSTVTLRHVEIAQTKIRKWYPKIGLTPVYVAECEVLEPSLGLSFLKSYSGEEEEEDVAIENNFEQLNKEDKTNLDSELKYIDVNVKGDQRRKSIEKEKEKEKTKCNADKKNETKKRKNIRKQKDKQEESDSEESSNSETESDDRGSKHENDKKISNRGGNLNNRKDSHKAKKNKKNFRKERKKKKKKKETEKSDSEKNEREKEIDKGREQRHSKSKSHDKEYKNTKHMDVEEKSLNQNDNKLNSSEEVEKNNVKSRNTEERKLFSPRLTRRDEENRKSYSKHNEKVQSNLNEKRSKSNDKSYHREKGSSSKRRDISPGYRSNEKIGRRKSTSSSRKSKSPERKKVSRDNDRNTDYRKENKNDKKFRSNSHENSQRRVNDEISRENQRKPKVKSIAETEFGTPDTNDYHSNWESDNELTTPVKDEQSMAMGNKATENIWRATPTREESIFSIKSPSTSSYYNKKIIADEFQISPRRSRSPKRQKCRKSVTPPFRVDYREFRRQKEYENKTVEMPFFPSISYSLNSKDDTKSFEDSFQEKPRSRKTSPASEKSPRRIKTSDKSPKRRSQRCLQRDYRSPSRDDFRLEDESSGNIFDISEKYRSFEKSPIRRSTKRYLDYSPKRKKETKLSPVRDFRSVDDNYKSITRENRTSVERNTIFRRSNSAERRLSEVGSRRSVSVEKVSHFRRSASLERMPDQHRISSTDENFRKKTLNQISPSIDYNISPSSYHKTEHSSYDVLSSFGGPLEMPLNIRHKRRESLEVTWKNEDFVRSNRRISYKESSYQIFSEDSWERDDYKKIDLEMEERTLEEERLRLIEERRKVAMERRQLEEMEMERRKAEEFEIEREKLEYERRQIENKRRRITESIGGNDSALLSDDDLGINRNYRERKHTFSGLTYSKGKTKHLDVESKTNFSYKRDCLESSKENINKGKVGEESEKRSVSRSSEKQKDIDICSEPLNISCSSNEMFLESFSKSKPELLENEYEKFMQAVSKSEKVSDSDINYIQKEKSERRKSSEKRTEAKRKKRYSTSSSSTSSSSSSGSSSSDSSSSGYTDSESSSSDSEPKKTKSKRLVKHKHTKDISSERIPEEREFSKVIIKLEPPDDEVVVKSISVLTQKEVDEFNLAPIKSEKTNTPKPVSPVSVNKHPNIFKTNFTDVKLLDIPLPGSVLPIPFAAKPSVAEIPLPSLPTPVPTPVVAPTQIVSSTVASTSDFSSLSPIIKIEEETSKSVQVSPSKKGNLIPIKLLSAEIRKQANESPLTVSIGTIDVKSSNVSSTTLTEDDKIGDDSLNIVSQGVKRQTRFIGMSIPNKKLLLDRSVLFGDEDDEEAVEVSDSSVNKVAVELSEKVVDDLISSGGRRITSHDEELKVTSNDVSGYNKAKETNKETTDFHKDDTEKIFLSPKLEKSMNKSPSKSYDNKYSKVHNKRRDSSRDRSKRRRSTSPYKERRRESPRKRGLSPKRRSPRHKRDSRRRSSISPRRKSPRRDYSPRRRSPSPRRRRELSPKRREGSPKRRAHSPRRRDLSPRRRANSPSPLKNKNESIQEALQRIAGINQPSIRIHQSPPVASPVDGSRKSVADSTISDEQLMLQNAGNITESPVYYSKQFQNTSAPMHCDSPISPRRPSLDERIVKELGAEKDDPTKLTEINVNYEQIYGYNMEFYDQYSENYHLHYHQDQHIYNASYHNPQIPAPVSKVVQVGNVLQVVPTDDLSKLQPSLPVPHPKQEPSGTQKILQVGNMLQIVPTVVPIPAPVEVSVEVVAEKGDSPPPPASMLLPEVNMKKIERQNEKEKRKLERERKRQEKKVRRLEREKKRQIKLNQKTEDMIKQALLEETGEGVNSEKKTDENEFVQQWPPMLVVTNNLKPPGKGILLSSRMNISGVDDEVKVGKKKSVSFSDGILPGEGTSPSGGEELCSPPPPTKKLPKGKKLKKSKTSKKVKPPKKKVKVKVIRQQNQTEEEDGDGDEDNLPPPPPPPGSPPPHIFPPRIKTHINNVMPSLMSTLPNSQVLPPANSYNLYRHPLPVIIPPPISHHGGPPGSSGLHGPGGLPGPHSVPHVPPPGPSHPQGSHATLF